MSQSNGPTSLADQVNPKRIAMLVAFVLLSGTVFYHIVEDLSWVNSFYFCVVTLTTVGYGDITPKTDFGKLFTSLYILIGVGIIAASLSYLVRQGALRRINNRNRTED